MAAWQQWEVLEYVPRRYKQKVIGQSQHIKVGRQVVVVVVAAAAVGNWAESQLRAAVTEAWGQYRNTEEGEHPLLEAVTRKLVKTQETEKT
jgi:hypothetical protein